jgi:stage V sporulation protein G
MISLNIKTSKERGEFAMAQEKHTPVTTKIDSEVYPIPDPKNKIVAYASVVIDDKFVINGMSVINGEKGLFVNMPQTRDNQGKYHDVCHPIISDLRQQISDAVLNKYVVALDALVEKRESTVAKLREAARAVKERPAAPTREKTAQKSEPAL